MEQVCHQHTPYVYKLEDCDIQVGIKEHEEMVGGEGSFTFGDCALGPIDQPETQRSPNSQGDMNQVGNFNYIVCEVATPSSCYHQSLGQLQLENMVPLNTRVAQPQRSRRPRIRRGLTPWQLGKLQRVFEDVQYPDVITTKNLAKHLYMKESEVHRWFKKQRAKYRKYQLSQMFQGPPDVTPTSFHKVIRGALECLPIPEADC